MQDIQNSADIRLLIQEFYKKAVADPLLGHIFTDVAKTDFASHLPVMFSFWEFLLLGQEGFRGNLMDAHQRVHDVFPLTGAHFERWLALWDANTDQHFAGPKAEEAKQRARSIADVTRFKLASQQPYFQSKPPDAA